MDWQNIDWQHATPYIVPLLVVALLARRLIRNPPRKVKVGRLFIQPVIALAATAATLAATPAPPLFWIVGYAIALGAGVGIGFLSAHHQEFALDSETGTITSRATPIGSILVVVLFAVRFGLKLVFPQLGGSPGGHPSADVLAWTDAGLVFSSAMIVTRAVVTWLRTKPLIDAHKSAKITPPA
ncbi:MAG: hypothetical protein ACREHE_03395 [Rhizomicrobium sp.]